MQKLNSVEKYTMEDFRKSLMDDAKVSGMLSGNGLSLSFVETVINELKDTSFIDDPKTFYWKGKGASNRDILIYGYDINEIDNTVSVYTSLCEDSDNIGTVTRSAILETAERGFRFLEESLSPSKAFKDSLENDAADFRDLISDLEHKGVGITKFRAVFITNHKISSRVTRLDSDRIINEIPTEIQVWDIERLYNLLVVSASDHEDVEIDFTSLGTSKQGIPFLEIPQDEENKFSSYLTAFSGHLLAEMYYKYGSQLLEGNVRSFLSTKTAVNKKIQATILNEPGKFFVYNNGISATASEIEIDRGRIIKIKNIQIINGGQTTASLAWALYRRKVDLSLINVQVKLTVIQEADPEEVSKTIQAISRSSNSQNKVSDADFFANHEFHVLIEKMSKQIQAPPKTGSVTGTYWFYERAKGQYTKEEMFLSDSKREKFRYSHPKTQLVTKTDWAKYHNSWKGFPQTVSKGAMTNFNAFAKDIENDWESNSRKSVYNELYFKQVCCIGLIYRELEKNITVHKQDWYLGSYRANVVTYTIAIFFKLLSKQHPESAFHFQKLWEDQEISQSLQQTLLMLAKEVYLELTNDNREVENVTQWCKRDACWKNIQSHFKDFVLDGDLLRPYLMNKAQADSAKDDARKAQKLDNEIELLRLVASNERVRRWRPFIDFLIANKIEVSPTETELLAVEAVAKMCEGRGGNPPLFVLQNAWGVWQRAVDSGWKN